MRGVASVLGRTRTGRSAGVATNAVEEAFFEEAAALGMSMVE